MKSATAVQDPAPARQRPRVAFCRSQTGREPDAILDRRSAFRETVGAATFYRIRYSPRGVLRFCCPGVKLTVALFYAARPLMPSDDDPDMVRASTLTGGRDFLLRFPGRQGEHLVAEGRRAAAAAACSRLRGPGRPPSASPAWSDCLGRCGRRPGRGRPS